ncbi:MAG: 4-diphosphocytidyl-2-C-methyl-D-erythritol kinase, partial [Solirubrobacteraceae bacterium]|nr:4-diphosphocytidyl-2-C-methyl-D-erythritol kinase [Solirubrobacteraceae bacterium]
APAKINVCLFLGPTREADGRHELVSVMQAVTLTDEVSLVFGAGSDTVACPGVVGDNLALAAIRAFRARTGWRGPSVHLDIVKRIPVAAGMAGGSADAGAALRLLAAEAGVDDDALLRQIAAGLGADVPAQVRPGRVLATGAGEEVEMLAPPPPYGILVVPSREHLRTPDVFREADRLGLPRDRAALDEALAAVREHAADLPDALVVNELEPAARSLCPSIDATLGRVRDLGADHALVSGSGPTVLGLFARPERAEQAARELGDGAVAVRPWGSA